ncbi:MAG: hypothetical protein IPH13_12935 [Planctomycetes bacterium]|nr:hypothetical protein [Planctomycetota bacterium]
MIAACSSCSASFDVSKKAPGATFRCPKCKTGTIQVPEAASEVAAEPELEPLDEAPAAAPTPRAASAARSKGSTARTAKSASTGSRTASSRTARSNAPASGGPNKAVLAIGGIAVIGIAAFFALRGGDSDTGSGPASTQGGTPASNGAGTAPLANGSTASDSNATTAKPAPAGETFEQRRAKLPSGDVGARVELAKFAAANGKPAEAKELHREALLLDADQAEARAALGFTKYTGPAAAYQGRWLSATDAQIVAAREKLLTGSGELAQASTSADVFTREAEDLRKGLQSQFPDEKFTYSYADGVMPQPFVVLIDKNCGDKFEAYRAEYAEMLGALKEAFFDRYREQFQLDEIETPIPVVIFDSVKAYSSHRANFAEEKYPDPKSGVLGFYQPWNKRLMLWRQKELRGVLLHEGAHLLIHYAFSKRGFEPSNQSPWFQEGFAEYFGGNKVVKEKDENGVERKRYVLGQMLRGRYAVLRAMMESKDALSLKDLVRVNHQQFNEAKESTDFAKQALVNDIYGQGWAFIMFLHYFENGRYKKAFDNYFVAETQGAGHYGTLEEELGISGEEGWAAMDKTFKTWVVDELGKL